MLYAAWRNKTPLSSKQIAAVLSSLNWWRFSKYSMATHLGLLRTAGLVTQKKEYYGDWIYIRKLNREVRKFKTTWQISVLGQAILEELGRHR